MSCEASTDANLKKAVARVTEAAEAGAKLICLPELFRAQYFCQREDHTRSSMSPSPSPAPPRTP
jgi:N-carbamoylputrescine amidase